LLTKILVLFIFRIVILLTLCAHTCFILEVNFYFSDALENKLEKFSSDNLKSILCIYTDISKKPALVVDDMSTSTSHASDFELDSIEIKHMIVDTACLENSCLNNHLMPKFK